MIQIIKLRLGPNINLLLNSKVQSYEHLQEFIA